MHQAQVNLVLPRPLLALQAQPQHLVSQVLRLYLVVGLQLRRLRAPFRLLALLLVRRLLQALPALALALDLLDQPQLQVKPVQAPYQVSECQAQDQLPSLEYQEPRLQSRSV